MKNKERAADIGRAERRVLQPQVACGMARMSSVKRAEFAKQVQQAVEDIVYAAKRRYVRRQQKLDETGVFHPQANAQRVHTQMWADLNNRVDITKIENEVWAKMTSGVEHGGGTSAGSPPKPSHAVTRRSAATGAGSRTATANDSDSATPSSKDSSRHDVVSSSKVCSDDDAAKEGFLPAVDEASLSATQSQKFAGILGYEELGHVPTLDEFRSEWPKLRSRIDLVSPVGLGGSGVGGSSKGARWKHQAQGVGQAQQQGPGSVVNDLAKKDEVFRHFKKYYDKVDRNKGRVGDATFPAGVDTTGLLQPDFGVIEGVGRHTAQAQGVRCRSRIGEGVLSAPGGGTGATRRSGGRRRSRENPGGLNSNGSFTELPGKGCDGLTNIFRQYMLGGDDLSKTPAQGEDSSLTCAKGKVNSGAADSLKESVEDTGGDEGTSSGSLTSTSGPPQGVGGLKSSHSNGSKDRGIDSKSAKAFSDASSTSAELQSRLETSWRALFVPARQKLGFLQKYCTLERVLELPRMAHLLEIASKAVPLREKVIDHVHRIEDDGEIISAVSVFSATEEGALYDLDCWEQFGADAGNFHGNDSKNNGDDDLEAEICPDDDRCEGTGSKDDNADDAVEHGEGEEGSMEEANKQVYRWSTLEREMRLRVAGAVLAWLRSIESKLAEKCAEVCDAAWYNLGETITYKGRPVANNIPPEVMEAATKRREDGEGGNKHGTRAR